MKSICAWCKKYQGEVPPLDSDAETHGICAVCLKKVRGETKGATPMKNARSRKNPGAAYHASEAMQEEVTERRAATKGKATQAAFHRGKAVAHRQSEAKARSLNMNPRGPGRASPRGRNYSAKIEGVIYNSISEIRAQKTKWEKGFYKHPFGPGAKIYGLDNGDLLIHSTAGERLWSRKEHV